MQKKQNKMMGEGVKKDGSFELKSLVSRLKPQQKQAIKVLLNQYGYKMGKGQKVVFLGLLASLGIPLSINLVKNIYLQEKV